MKTPTWVFMAFWAITGLTFLKLGFNALDRTNLSDSVSPVVMFLFKHALALSLCHSSHYAFVYLPVPETDLLKHTFCVGAALNPLVMFSTRVLGPWYFLYCALIKLWTALDKRLVVSTVPGIRIGLEIDFIIKFSMYCIEDSTNFFPTCLLYTAALTSSIWHTVLHDETELEAAKQKGNPMIWNGATTSQFCLGLVCAIVYESENSSSLKKMLYKRRELIKFGIGMVGTIFFQNFFRLNTIDHVLAFLYLIVAWLANLAMLQATDDLGIFNFLLANVIVGCTVSQFGLRGPTWLAFGASVILYGLRLKLKSVSLVNRGLEQVNRGLGGGREAITV